MDVAFSGGEPLLHPNIFELVSHAKRIGLRAGLSTNGYTVTLRTLEKLIKAGLDRLQVSLDGIESTHDQIRGGGAFQHAVKAINLSVASGLPTNCCFTAMKTNYLELGEVIDFVARIGVVGFNLSKLVPTGRGEYDQCLTPDMSEKVLNCLLSFRQLYPGIRFTSHLAGLCEYDSQSLESKGFIGCQAGIYIACVLVNGDVTPCVLFPLVIGNLLETPFKTIWKNSSEINLLKSRELSGLCGGCDMLHKCGGCRASALYVSKDYLAEDPLCPRVVAHARDAELSTIELEMPSKH